MKKLLLLLLCTVSIYGQQEQDFDYGIKNTASQLDDNAPFLTVQDSTGVLKKSSSSVWAKKLYVTNLPKPTLQQVTTAGNTTTNPIVVTTADFAGIAIQGTSNDNIGVLGTSNTGIGGAFTTLLGTKIASFSFAAIEKAFIASDGTITATAGTADGHVVVKSQLDLKANDANVIHTTGNETKTGTLTVEVASGDAIFGDSLSGTGIRGYSDTGTAGYFYAPNGTGIDAGSSNGLAGNFNTNFGSKIVSFKANSFEKAFIASDGTITATAGTADGHVVVKSQLDAKANDTDVLHTTGNETKTGRLTVSTTGINSITATSDNGTGIYSSSTTSIPAVFNLPTGNTSNITEFKKNGVNQASISHDGKLTAKGAKITTTPFEFWGNESYALASFGITENSEQGRGYLVLDNKSADGNGSGINFKSGASNNVLFQLDGFGNYVSRTSQGGMYFDNFGASGGIYFRTGGANIRQTITNTGNLLIGTTADNGIDQLQVPNGTISAVNYTGSATLTGTPTAPTATVGTNTKQVATMEALQTALTLKQDVLVSGTNIKTINGNSILGIGNVSAAFFDNASQSILGSWLNGSFNYGSIGIRQSGGTTDGVAMYLNSEQAFIYGGTARNMNVGTLKTDGVINTSINNVTKTITSNSRFESLVPIKLKNYTVATLPTGVQGDTAYVTDATAPTYLGTLTGGGAIVCPVFFDGVSWKSH